MKCHRKTRPGVKPKCSSLSEGVNESSTHCHKTANMRSMRHRTLFLKCSSSVPLINADPHGSVGGWEPARLPSSAQMARNEPDVRLWIVVALWCLVQDPQECLSHGTEGRGLDVI